MRTTDKIAVRKERLEQEAKSVEAQLKHELDKTGSKLKKWTIIGSSLLLSYSFIRLMTRDKSEAKFRESKISSAIKQQLVAFVLSAAKEKLLEALKDKNGNRGDNK